MTSTKYHLYSFFVDGESNYTFFYHYDSILADETTLAKRACEAELRKQGEDARQYHAGNDNYVVAKNKGKIEEKKQSLNFVEFVAIIKMARLIIA